MTVDARAHALPTGEGQLETLAGSLFGKPYRKLTDAEAGQVWDAIEDSEDTP